MKPADVAALFSSLDGVARSAELARLGVSAYSLRVATRSGVIDRVRPGLYALPSRLSPQARQALAHGGVLACVSAAAEAGLWVMPYEGTHVWMSATGHEHPHVACDCVAHWDANAGQVCDRIRVDVVHALVQLAFCLGEEPFFVAYESALRLGALTKSDRAALRKSLPLSFDRLFMLARSTADSGLESITRFRLFRLGITVEGQVQVPGVGVVDLVIGDRLIIELDGKDNHDGASKRHKDLRRDALAAALGYETLRFDYALVLYEWDLVEDAILAKLAAGAHESFAGRRMRAETRR